MFLLNRKQSFKGDEGDHRVPGSKQTALNHINLIKVMFFSITQQCFSSVHSVQRNTRHVWLIQPYILHPEQWPCFSICLMMQGSESNTLTLPCTESHTRTRTRTHTHTHTEDKCREECSSINYKMVFYCTRRQLGSRVLCFFRTNILKFKWSLKFFVEKKTSTFPAGTLFGSWSSTLWRVTSYADLPQ